MIDEEPEDFEDVIEESENLCLFCNGECPPGEDYCDESCRLAAEEEGDGEFDEADYDDPEDYDDEEDEFDIDEDDNVAF